MPGLRGGTVRPTSCREKPGLGALGFNPEERVHTALSSQCKSGSDEPDGLQAVTLSLRGPRPYHSQLHPPHPALCSPTSPSVAKGAPRQRDLHTQLVLQRPLLATHTPHTRPRQERKGPQIQAHRELQSLTWERPGLPRCLSTVMESSHAVYSHSGPGWDDKLNALSNHSQVPVPREPGKKAEKRQAQR